ncbi:MAG: hypothetical protein GTO30_04430, partial [Acidobacteria bacterium]|nr:hypothetical protein [Acidobacteriota bacterium]NIQ83523.1 hypothetical protein [Acidobacteriota bacterium]
DYLADPSLLVGIIRTAGVLVGGVVGGAIVFVLYARRNDLPLIRLADAVVAPLALAQALGRFGCLAAGCCYGVPVDADHPFAVTFEHPQAIAAGRFAGQPLLAVQLLEALADLVIVAILTLLWRRRPKPEGTVLWCYVLLYSILRVRDRRVSRRRDHAGVRPSGRAPRRSVVSPERAETLRLEVPVDAAGQRLDRFLQHNLPGRSRSV